MTEQVSRSLESTAMVSDVRRMPGPLREQSQLGGRASEPFPLRFAQELMCFKSCHLLTWKNHLTLRQKRIRA